MKNLDSQSYNVEELSARELVEIVGGNWWSDFKEGFKEGLLRWFKKTAHFFA